MVRAVLAAVILGGVFGSAGATVESIEDDVMVIDLEVEVIGATDSVVAHLTFDNSEELTLPLLDRDDGTYGIRTELETKNYVVVFEAVGEEASDPVSLTELGADLLPQSVNVTTDPDDDGLSDESRRSLWLSVALGAAALSLLAFWVLGGRDEARKEKATVEEEE
jgi:hypothetical protein